MNDFLVKNKKIILLMLCLSVINFIVFAFVSVYVTDRNCLVMHTYSSAKKIVSQCFDECLVKIYGKIEKKILVIGFPKSGTTYAGRYWRALGYDVQDEKLGKDGMSSWVAVVPDKFSPRSHSTFDRDKVKFCAILHQIRNPLSAISSFLARDGAIETERAMDEAWGYMCSATHASMDDSSILRAVRVWVEWNKKAEEMADFSYRIEDWNKNKDCIRDKIFDFIGVEKDRRLKGLDVSQKTNSWVKLPGYRKISEEDIKMEVKDKGLLREFQALCEKYHYDVNVL